jgi:hypothetical protein
LVSYVNNTGYLVIARTPASAPGVWVATTLSTPAWHGASIACRPLTNGTAECRAAYQSNSLTARIVNFGVDTDGTLTGISTSGVGYYTNDTPSIVWNPADLTYRLALRQGFGAIYSYKSTPPSLAWVGTGEIVNTGTSLVSTPALSTTASGQVTAWWMRWW